MSIFLLLAVLSTALAIDLRRSAGASSQADQRAAERRAVSRAAADLDELLATAAQLRRTVDVLGVVGARRSFPVLAQQAIAIPVATSIALEQTVPTGDVERFEREAHFTVDRGTGTDEGRPHLVVTSAVSVDVAGSSLWGLDVFVDPKRRAVLRQAFATGVPRATPPVSGLRRIGTGTTLYLPLERRSGMPMPDVVGVSLDLAALGTQLRSSLPAGTEVAIRDARRAIAVTDRRALGGTSRPYSFAGRTWTLSAWAPAAGRSGVWLSVLIGGLVASALLSALVGTGLTRLRRGAAERRALADRVGDLFEHSQLGMVVTDHEHRIVEVNPAIGALLDRPPERMLGRHVMSLVDGRDRDRLLPVAEDLEAGRRARLDGEVRLLRADGSPVWTQMNATPQRGPDGELIGLLLQVNDIEQRRVEQALLQRLAERDSLTGALNRRSFDARLERHLAACEAGGACGAVYVVDLDRFKQINDAHGHAAGDRLLIAIADALHGCLRSADALARTGGDEFAFLVADGTDPDRFEAVAARIRRAIDGVSVPARPGFEEGPWLSVTVSVGWTAVQDPTVRPGALLESADAAMYLVKRGGHHA